MSDLNRNSFKGFTLAEILITLGIIGVVASMTIPTLISNQQEQSTVVAVKKAYSILSQAYELAVLENGSPDSWGLETATGAGAVSMLDKLGPYLKVIKNCGVESGSGCFPLGTYYKFLSGTNDIIWDNSTARARAQLADGMLISTYVQDQDCKLVRGSGQSLTSVCGTVYFDINGIKPPNQWGKDFFGFYLTKYGVVPTGIQLADGGGYGFQDMCQNSSATGWTCTGWVVYNGNLDYSKTCSLTTTLSWNGPKSCN